jgi:LacI family transcriptional regulator, repressor for deo operon, udp, cdd, tsx, nupC, and nupG
LKRPSIGDVARQAGVSTATVSRAINAPESVTEATRRRVEEAIEALHYVQSITAKNFKSQRSLAVLVVANDIGNIYYSELFRGIQRRAEASGYSIIITNPTPGSTQDLIVTHLRTAKVDGVIVLSGYEITPDDFALLTKLYSGTPPVVAMSEERGTLDVPHILIDNERAGYLAGKHLIEMGHTRIGHVMGPHGTPVRRARMAGLERALGEAGLTLRKEDRFEGGFSTVGGRSAAQQFMSLKARPTAVFCANDESAMGFISQISKYGLSVPKDVSVLGFDDIVLAESYVPALSTMHQPKEEMGRQAMALLLDLIENRPPEGTHTCVELQVHMVPRDSVRRAG